MSETPIYFFIAQLNSLLTGGLRLGYGFFVLAVLMLCGSFWVSEPAQRDSRRGLASYWLTWSTGLSLLALSSALALSQLLAAPNVFLKQGIYSTVGLLIASGMLLVFQYFKRGRWGLCLSLPVALFCVYAYSFSRSDKDLFSIVLALPVALGVSYFPLCFFKQNTTDRLFHSVFLWLLLPVFFVYYGWMYPLIKHIPAAGEFYPFINLYDWILPLFVILYSGNVYIDYWLNKRKSILVLMWNYPVAVAAILCQWLNTNILDTLAL